MSGLEHLRPVGPSPETTTATSPPDQSVIEAASQFVIVSCLKGLRPENSSMLNVVRSGNVEIQVNHWAHSRILEGHSTLTTIETYLEDGTDPSIELPAISATKMFFTPTGGETPRRTKSYNSEAKPVSNTFKLYQVVFSALNIRRLQARKD